MLVTIDLMLGKPPANEERYSKLPHYVKYLKERLDKVNVFARNKLQLSSNRMKVRFDKNSGPNDFKGHAM